MKLKTFRKNWVDLQDELDAALLGTSRRKKGHTAWALWWFSARCMTEVFAVVQGLESQAKSSYSSDEFAGILQDAEEDIARGVRKLALLVADSRVHNKLTTKFKQFGLAHPYVSHVGFRVRNDPVLSRRMWRFLAKRHDKDVSLTAIQNSLWLYLRQLEREL